MSDAAAASRVYTPRTPWSPFPAIVASLLILLTSVGAGLGVYGILETLWPSTDAHAQLALSMLTMQAVVVALIAIAAGRFGGAPAAVLSLDVVPSRRVFIWSLVGLAMLLTPYNLIVYAIAPEVFINDLKPFQGLIQSPAGPLFWLVIGIGAPLSEELAFRGFLQSALARSRLGFAGAGVLTTVSWTALHAGYSAAGLLEVLAIGFYFVWLLGRTGSLWPAIVCHAVYNSLLFIIVRTVSFPA